MPANNFTNFSPEQFINNEDKQRYDKMMEEKYNTVMGDIVKEVGEPVSDDEAILVNDNKSELLNVVDKAKHTYDYDGQSDLPIPGEEQVYDKTLYNSNSAQGVKELINMTATLKAEKEKKTEDEKKKFAQRKAQMKPELVSQIMYQEEQAYFEKNKHMLSGSDRRRLRRIIEKNYDKGRYNKYIIPEGEGLPLN